MMTDTTSGGTRTAADPSRAQTAPEHQSMVIAFNNTAADCPTGQTIVQLVEAQVQRTPDDEAVRAGDRSLTYAEMNSRANQIAAHLTARGVGPDQLVTLYMEHSLEVVCSILGVLKAGAAYAPVDPTIPPERLTFMLQDIGAGLGGKTPVLMTQPRLAGRVQAGVADVVTIDADFASVAHQPASNPNAPITPANLAYVIYTSGSTGKPKGVMIEHRNLVNYIWWANQTYNRGERLAWPLFSSLAFDLTVTSIFTPLISGGRIVVYWDDTWAHGTVILKVVEDNRVDIIKLTPAHLSMIKDLPLGQTRIRAMILGGEDFKTELARDVTRAFGRPVDLYNEYGPTEATVGCMIHRFDAERDRGLSVPIGVPIANDGIYVLDEAFRPVPPGVIGEMYLAGAGLARGYFNRPDLTAERFRLIPDPRTAAPGAAAGAATLRVYKSGDLARWASDGRMEFLGRADHQVKIGGARVELGEIEARLLQHAAVRECAVGVVSTAPKSPAELRHCSRCGVKSNFPGTKYDADGVCNWCLSYDTYAKKAEAYFKTRDEFQAIVRDMKGARSGGYDCIALFSGGKDSTFMLYKLFEAGLKPLAFSLDNGYISEEAKTNIRRVTDALGVDLHWGTTPHMNEIFVDSLNQFSNVCNGCFKTIYTLAINLAKEKGIRYIVTGLSRGQFFETRLTEEVFRRKDFDAARLDAIVLEARKAYHQRKDAVTSHIDSDLDMRGGSDALDTIEFVDFYRYWSVPLEELYATLHKYGAWSRPSDTGRSTNCLINDLGIYLHKKQRGFHNYSLPYGWDVRLGQKTREEAMEELEDEIDEARVKQIMKEIGYVEPAQPAKEAFDRLAAYYVSEAPVEAADLRAHLARELPDYMLPTYFVRLDRLPLTSNGKVDRQALPAPSAQNMLHAADLAGPQTETEKALAAVWVDLLQMESIGVNDSFFELGGHSLLAIRAVSRIREAFDVDLPFQTLFANPTIASLSRVVEEAQRSGGAAAEAAAAKSKKRVTSARDAASRIG